MIMGTAAYMSPEQASGKPVDKRADIWSFGVVFFEMLTGKRLFDGETISHTLAAVLTKEPDLQQVPVKVRRLLQVVPGERSEAEAARYRRRLAIAGRSAGCGRYGKPLPVASLGRRCSAGRFSDFRMDKSPASGNRRAE